MKVLMIIITLLFFGLRANTQSLIIAVMLNDTISLIANDINVIVQWQQSKDSLKWNDIPNATTKNSNDFGNGIRVRCVRLF